MIGHLARLFAGIRSLLFRSRDDRDLAEDFQAHLDLLTQDNIARGMDPEAARRDARIRFGNPRVARELEREARGVTWLQSLVEDVRYGLRQLRGNKTFAGVTIGTLALGIGGSTLVFSLVHAVFWDTLPVRNPEELVQLRWSWTSTEGEENDAFSYNEYATLRESGSEFADLSIEYTVLAGVLGEWGSARVQAVSGDYFRTLGVNAVLGRTFTPDDDRFGDSAPVAVISYGLWQRAFGGSDRVLGQDIVVRGTPVRIIGVLPPGMAGLNPAIPRDVILPVATFFEVGVTRRPFDPDNAGFTLLARLLPGSSSESAAAEAEALLGGVFLSERAEDALAPPRIETEDIRQDADLQGMRERKSAPLILLMTMVGAILAMACANIAGLLLARSHARAREIATRLALGASRGRVIRQLLVESLTLSLAGGVAGIGIAWLLNPLLPPLFGQLLGNVTLQGHLVMPSLDAAAGLAVMGVSFVLMLATGCGFGLVPALAGTRMDLSTMMKPRVGHSGIRSSGFLGHKTLVGVQVALAVPLVAGAGLLIQSVSNLESVPIGYDPDNLLFAMVASRREDRPRVVETLRRIESLPGVRSATVSVWPLFNNAEPRSMCVPVADPVDPQTVDLEYVFPRFFETWGVPVLSGREFLADGETGGVAVVNEAFARRYYGAGSPLGGTIAPWECPGTPHTIVGMVADHVGRQRVELVPMIYLPYPTEGALEPNTFALRTMGNPTALIPRVREIIADAGFNSDGDVATGTAYRDRTMRLERFLGTGLLLFAGVALFVAALGVYGMLSYSVRCRLPEIGVRMALGAQRSRIRRMVLRQSLAPVALGVVAGIAVAVALGRLIESLVFGVGVRDPFTMGTTGVILLATAFIAAFAPANRASRVDPMRTLRQE